MVFIHKMADIRLMANLLGPLKKTFITTVLTAVKKNKQPTHTSGPGRLRSWSGPVETDFQGRLRFSYDNRPECVEGAGQKTVTS